MSIKWIRIILRIIFVALHVIAWYSASAYYDDMNRGGGSPESKALGLLFILIAIPLFLCWVMTIWALYFMYGFFFKDTKKSIRISSWVFLIIVGVVLYLLREDTYGRDGVTPLYVLYSITWLVSFLSGKLKEHLRMKI